MGASTEEDVYMRKFNRTNKTCLHILLHWLCKISAIAKKTTWCSVITETVVERNNN